MNLDKCHIGPIAYMVLEFWLGKTKRVRANSVIEAVITFSLTVFVMSLIFLQKIKGAVWKRQKEPKN